MDRTWVSNDEHENRTKVHCRFWVYCSTGCQFQHCTVTSIHVRFPTFGQRKMRFEKSVLQAEMEFAKCLAIYAGIDVRPLLWIVGTSDLQSALRRKVWEASALRCLIANMIQFLLGSYRRVRVLDCERVSTLHRNHRPDSLSDGANTCILCAWHLSFRRIH